MDNDQHLKRAAAGTPFRRSVPSAARTLERSGERSFWMGLLYAGVIAYWAVAPGVLAYAALTGTRGHRVWIDAIAAAALGAMVAIYLLRQKIVAAAQREWIFFAWNTTSFIIITLLCVLDGGVGSPFAYLFALPMLYLAIGYRLRTTLICGGAGVCCYAVLLWMGAGPSLPGQVLFQLLMLGVGFLMAILGARNRDRQDHTLHVLRQQLETLAMTDELTGCLNQRAFKAALHREVARAARHGRALSLLLIDIDHFKRINDRHGHLVGDAVLRQMGAVLRATARETDCVGRPGGDELAVLAPDTDGAAALVLAERVRAQARSAALPIQVTLSIGVCAIPLPDEQATELFRRADEAMYVAKRRGRDRVALWNPDDVLSARASPASMERAPAG